MADNKRKRKKQQSRNQQQNSKSGYGDPNMITRFLSDTADDVETRLSLLAQQKLQAADLERFKSDLLTKLKRVPYSQPRDPSRHNKTFYDRLEAANALGVILHPETLRSLFECRLLKDIGEADRELEQKGLSVTRHPLKCHSLLISELDRHEKTILAMLETHGISPALMAGHFAQIDREKMRQLRTLSLSRFPGSRKKLFRGRVKETLAAEENTYWTLKTVCTPHRLPDRFLRRLAQLVVAPPDVTEMLDEQEIALSRAITRRKR